MGVSLHRSKHAFENRVAVDEVVLQSTRDMEDEAEHEELSRHVVDGAEHLAAVSLVRSGPGR
jgi:hypothetical protein